MDVSSLLRDKDAEWIFQPSTNGWKLSWRSYGPMEAVVAHRELMDALIAAGATEEHEWAEGFRLEILGSLAEEPIAKEWLRDFNPPLVAGDGLGEILAERQTLEQGMAMFSGDPGMVARRETQIRLAKPAFYEVAGAVVWVDGAARAWI